MEWHENNLYCQTFTEISILDIDTGIVTCKIGEENSEDADTIQTFTSNGEMIATSHKSGLLKLWNNEGQLMKMWKYIHKGPIAKLTFNKNQLYSGGSDGVIRTWDIIHQACLMSLKECPGVITIVQPHLEKDILFANGDDCKIYSWSTATGKLETIYNGHFSKVTSVSFYPNNNCFISSGRDKVLILWEIGQAAALKTIPLYEALETVICLPVKFKLPSGHIKDGLHVATAGENGIIRIWDIEKPKEIYQQSNSLISKSKEEGGLAILKLLFNASRKQFGVVSAEHAIILHDIKTFNCFKQFVGFSDEILDITMLGENDSHIVVATNSNDIKLYENHTMNCKLLRGHTDLVLAVSKSNNSNLFVSGSKDHSIRLWLLENDNVSCVAVGQRHTGSVTSLAFSQTATQFIVSASQDTCIKLWTVANEKDLSCSHTVIAHQKDINCVAVAPNDKIIASASQDKTAKLWTNELKEIGVLRGHKRGVWCVTFSPTDQVVMTSSADCTIKLWSIADLSCLKTIQSHESSVTKTEFISNGMQILSAGSDGLIKLFNIKTTECLNTFEEHDGKIWSFALAHDESGFISGGTDSQLIKWKDVTDELQLQRLKEQEELTIQEQKLNNYLQNDDFLKALKLALKLDRPMRVLKIVQSVMKKGDMGLGRAISDLKDYEKESLMKCATTWNTNSKNSQPAQLVINLLINELQKGDFRPVGLSKIIEGTLPYTERHFNRLTQLMQDVHFINYTINCMQLNSKSNL